MSHKKLIHMKAVQKVSLVPQGQSVEGAALALGNLDAVLDEFMKSRAIVVQ